jgi:hypothetical protein
MSKFRACFLMVIVSLLFHQELKPVNENLIQSTPEWYRNLPPSFKPIEDKRIMAIESLRIKCRATHENCMLSVLSTPWAVEKAQYDSLKMAEQAYPKAGERELWKMVLLSRFQTWIMTVGLETHEYSPLSPEKLKSKIEKMAAHVDSILIRFESFKDLVKFVICIEEELGNFIDPTGIMDELNSILGRGRPSEQEMQWYNSLVKRIQNET